MLRKFFTQNKCSIPVMHAIYKVMLQTCVAQQDRGRGGNSRTETPHIFVSKEHKGLQKIRCPSHVNQSVKKTVRSVSSTFLFLRPASSNHPLIERRWRRRRLDQYPRPVAKEEKRLTKEKGISGKVTVLNSVQKWRRRTTTDWWDHPSPSCDTTTRCS